MKHHRADREPTTAPILTPFNGEMMSAVTRAGEAYAQALTEWQDEMMTLANRQMEQGNAAVAKLSKCGTPLDLALLQQEWAIGAASACLEEMNKLFAIAVRCARTGMPGANGASGRGAEPTQGD